jgi:peptidoglycan biosynthesis protein MviN/MurJ (putative lipid II flippase)
LGLSALSLSTTALGLLNQVMLLRHFGAGTALDRYFQALAIPGFIAGQIALVFGYYLVPYYHRVMTGAGRQAFEQRFIRQLALLCIGLAVPGVMFSLLLAPGHERSWGGASPSAPMLLAALSWLSVMLANVGGAQGAFLNVRERFVLPATFPLLGQLGTSIALALDGGHDITVPLVGLNCGALAAVVLGQLALRASTQESAPQDLRSADDPNRPGLISFFRSASALPLVLSVFSAHFFIDALLAGRLQEGELSTLALSHRVNIGALGLLVAAFATPMTAELSREAASSERWNALLRSHLLRIALSGLAVCAFVGFNAERIAQLLVGSGKSTAASQSLMVDTIRVLACAGLPMLIGQFELRALLTCHRQRAAFIASAVWAICYLPMAWWSAPRHGALGLATTYLVAWTCLAFVVAVVLKLRPTRRTVAAFTLSSFAILLASGLGLELANGSSRALHGLMNAQLLELTSLASALAMSTAACVTVLRMWPRPAADLIGREPEPRT